MPPLSPPRKPKDAKVEISRGLLVALATTALAGVLGVTFLIGRESARGQQPTSPTANARASPVTLSAETTSGGNDQLPTSAPPTIEAPPLSPPQDPQPASRMSAPGDVPPRPNTASAPHDKLRDEVATYFREVEAIQSQAKSWNDPEALAQKLLDQAGRGDVSGFDGLAAANSKVRDHLRALSGLKMEAVEEGAEVLTYQN